jgi:hypothetical protein
MTRDNRCTFSPAPRFTLVFLLVLLWSSRVTAAIFTVTSLADAGPGSLRQAVLSANTSTGPDEIAFAPGLTGTITLTSGEIQIRDGLIVNGPGAGVLTVSGNDASRIFLVENAAVAAAIDVTLSGLTLTRGNVNGGELVIAGGAVAAVNENLTILDSVISDSRAGIDTDPAVPGCGGNVALIEGGALRIVNSLLTGGSTTGPGSSAGGNLCVVSGRLLLERSTLSGGWAYDGGGFFGLSLEEGSTILLSTISGNEAVYDGGGINANSSGTLTIDSSTISGNTVGYEQYGFGGGVSILQGNLRIINSTISGNSATKGGGGIRFGDLIGSGGGSLLLRLTTVSNNMAGVEGGGLLVGAPVIEVELDHSIVANGAPGDLARWGNQPATVTANYSLIESPGDTLLAGANNIIGSDPLLGPLANNGGPTQTHALLFGCPAIDAGNPAIPSPPATDQRGFARILGPAIDLGSVEGQALPAGVPTLSQWGLLLLIVLLCILGVRRLRRTGAAPL